MRETSYYKVISAGLEEGASFVDIFIEETRSSSIGFLDNKVEIANVGTIFGIGIRLVFGTEVLYASTSFENEEHLLLLVQQLAKTRKELKTNESKEKIISFREFSPPLQTILQDPKKVSQDKKLPFLKLANEIARKESEYISQVSVRVFDSTSNIKIINSEGLNIEDYRVYSRFTVSVTAQKNGELYTGSESPGAQKGFEFFENLDIGSLTKFSAQRALLMLNARYIQGGKMPVVMGNGFGGVIFHEACGHPLETEAIRKKSSPFLGKLGEKIAQDCLTAIDDGTIPNAWGSINIDDEGSPPEKTVLIENGILKNYLSDRIGAEEVGVRRTGSARRESYSYAPVARMRNTYIAKGKDKLEDMIASIEEGLYAKKMGGGSVNPATGEFNFAVEEGYVIRKGKIAEPVRGATLIGKGHEILPKISMVGDDLEISAGICGASSGSIPVTVGQPSIKVDEILVGGR